MIRLVLLMSGYRLLFGVNNNNNIDDNDDDNCLKLNDENRNRLRSIHSRLYANQRSALQITSFVHKSLEILLCCCTRKHSDLYALFITSQEIIDIDTWTNSFEALLHIDRSPSRAEVTRTRSTRAATVEEEFQKTHFTEAKAEK
jgi:hypothetical protein